MLEDAFRALHQTRSRGDGKILLQKGKERTSVMHAVGWPVAWNSIDGTAGTGQIGKDMNYR
jgi:hypothetical protein